jgi:hypothetical protein
VYGILPPKLGSMRAVLARGTAAHPKSIGGAIASVCHSACVRLLRLARTTVEVLALFSGLMACAVVRIVAGQAKTIRCGHLLGVLDEAGVLRTPAQRRRERCLEMLGRSALDSHAELHRLRARP